MNSDWVIPGMSRSSSPFQRFLIAESRRLMNQYRDFFVGWGTLSLINAGLAQSKRRSGFLWWLVSLLIGPVATFLIVFLPKATSDNEA